MEFKTICGSTGCLEGHQYIGIYRTDETHCILLDTGTVSLREELLAALDRAGLTPQGIIVTHSHYDHMGNAAWFQKNYHTPVCMPFGEAELCRTFPAIKSHLFVFSAGEIMSDPDMNSLPCALDRVIMPEENSLVFCGVKFTVLRTPGHSPEHISLITPDGVCYAGDALLWGRSLQNAKLPYAYNFRQAMESIRSLRETPCRYMLMAHGGVVEAPFDELVDKNIEAMEHCLSTVSGLIDRQMSVEEIYTAVRDTLGIRIPTPRRAQSMERFLRPYLECLLDDGTIRMSLRGTGTLCYEPNR